MSVLPAHEVEPEEIMSYADGELPVDRAAVIARHVQQCAACRELSEQLSAMSERLATWQVEPAPATLTRPAVPARRNTRLDAGRLLVAMRRVAGLALRRPVWSFIGAAAAFFVVMTVISEPTKKYVKIPVQEATPVSPAVLGRRGAGTLRPAAGASVAKRSALSADKPETQEAPASRETGSSVPPMVARTANLVIVVEDLDRARESIDRILADCHGYPADLAIDGERRTGQSLMGTLRVPAADFARVLARLRALGRVLTESQGVEDVTTQVVDLDARLSNARQAEIRLVDILHQRTGRIADVLAVEQEITRVRGEIERMEAERKGLSLRIEMATVRLNVSEIEKATADLDTLSAGVRLRNSAIDGYRNLVEAALELVLFLVSEGPRILFWLLALVATAWVVRKAWRRSGARIADKKA